MAGHIRREETCLDSLMVRRVAFKCGWGLVGVSRGSGRRGIVQVEGRGGGGVVHCILLHNTGTENPAAEEDRLRAAVNSKCGGSYCVTQRWIHQHDVIQNTKGGVAWV